MKQLSKTTTNNNKLSSFTLQQTTMNDEQQTIIQHCYQSTNNDRREPNNKRRQQDQQHNKQMVKRNTTKRDKHRAIIARNKPCCHICGQPINYTLPYPDPQSFVVDHLTALANGGTDTLNNKAAAHRACNRAKSDKTYAPIIKRSGALKHPGPETNKPAPD